MKRADRDVLVSEALRIRRWAVEALAWTGGPLPMLGEEALRGVSPRAWQLFLYAERCALPLRRRLREGGLGDGLPPDVRQVIDALAVEEMQRVLSARAQLERLSRWATGRGETVAVLKGAAAAVDDAWALDLSDVDVWVAPDLAHELLGHLGRTGHRPEGVGTAHHHPTQLAEQLVAIEVHGSVPYADLDPSWNRRLQPLGGGSRPGLVRMDAPDHLWHVLVHSTLQHVERRGRVRDLLLLVHARSLCSEAQRRDVLGRAGRHPHAQPLLAMLERAEFLESGRPAPDSFVRVAAGRYLGIVTTTPAVLRFHSARATASVLEGPRECLRFLREVHRGQDAASPVRALRVLQQRSPRLGGRVVLLQRAALRIAAMLHASVRAHRAGRLARSVAPSGS